MKSLHKSAKEVPPTEVENLPEQCERTKLPEDAVKEQSTELINSDITDRLQKLQISPEETPTEMPDNDPEFMAVPDPRATEIEIERGTVSPSSEPSSEPSSILQVRKMKTNDTDAFERIVEVEKYVKLVRAWKRCHAFKKVPRRSKPPNYLSEPLDLMYVETQTNLLRKWYNKEKYKNYGTSPRYKGKSFVSGDQLSPGMKTNRAHELRNAYIKRQPVPSSHFERHFARFRKPPFVIKVNRNVNLTNTSR